jgi:hypothetical protein
MLAISSLCTVFIFGAILYGAAISEDMRGICESKGGVYISGSSPARCIKKENIIDLK